MTISGPWRIRPATANDADFMASLAARLTIGRAAWLGEQLMEGTMRRFLLDDLAAMSDTSTVFIAEASDGTPVGAATIERKAHFTGIPQAYLGELAVITEVEGQGVGAALLAAVETWAREHGAQIITLETGSANGHARSFYARHGYGDESVKLTKVLT